MHGGEGGDVRKGKLKERKLIDFRIKALQMVHLMIKYAPLIQTYM